MINTPTDKLTKNSFIDKCLKLVPDHPLKQSQYIYYLSMIIFIGLFGYACVSWYNFATAVRWTSFFSGLFMTAVSFMSLFGVKQTRTTYKAMKAVYNMPKKDKVLESPTDMLNQFKKQVDDKQLTQPTEQSKKD